MLGARPLTEPGDQQPFDLRLSGLGVLPPEVLPHQLLSGLVEVEGDLEPLGEEPSGGVGHALKFSPIFSPPSLRESL